MLSYFEIFDLKFDTISEVHPQFTSEVIVFMRRSRITFMTYFKLTIAFSHFRTRSVILVDADNKVEFFEETMLTHDPDGEWKKTHLVTKI